MQRSYQEKNRLLLPESCFLFSQMEGVERSRLVETQMLYSGPTSPWGSGKSDNPATVGCWRNFCFKSYYWEKPSTQTGRQTQGNLMLSRSHSQFTLQTMRASLLMQSCCYRWKLLYIWKSAHHWQWEQRNENTRALKKSIPAPASRTHSNKWFSLSMTYLYLNDKTHSYPR